jgi:uncharacterized protein
MKTRLFITILIAFLSSLTLGLLSEGAEPDYPESIGYVNDFAGILSPETELKLNRMIADLDKQTTAQVAVATIESISPETVETYTNKLFEKWEVGQKDKDNGVLILVAVKERKTWIEVGYGLEGAIPDARASRIYRDIMVPSFGKGDFNGGISRTVEAIAGLVAEEFGVEIDGASVPPKIKTSSRTRGGWIFAFVILVVVLTSLLRSGIRRSGTSSRSGGFWIGGGSGGFSGGFGGGGFGGGMSGGGGAGGGW